MQEMTITPPPVTDAFSPPMSAQSSAGVMRTAVQLTFPLEIVSLQLTSAFKMCDLQLRSSSQLVTMRLASGNLRSHLSTWTSHLRLRRSSLRMGPSAPFACFPRIVNDQRWSLRPLSPSLGWSWKQAPRSLRCSSRAPAGRCFCLPHGRLPNRGDRILGLLRSSCNYAQLDLARRLPPTAWRRSESD